MDLLVMVAESFFLIVGSLAAAVVLCMALWHLFLLVRHPELGALVIVPLVVITLAMPLTHSPFVRMMMLFAMAGALPLWIAGREWRRNAKGEPTAPAHHQRHALTPN